MRSRRPPPPPLAVGRGGRHAFSTDPQPAGFAEAPITTTGAAFGRELGEFVLPYEAVRRAAKSREALLDVLPQTYAAAADLGNWDRAVPARPAT